jgi:hypothetical protein
MSDRASKALAEPSLPGEPRTYDATSKRSGVPISNCFGTHETLELLEFCFEIDIILCRLPSHTSHKLQPCGVGVFAPLKTAYRDEAERVFQGGTNTVGKQHFTSLYSPAREKAFHEEKYYGRMGGLWFVFV